MQMLKVDGYLPPVPQTYLGLWERTVLERYGDGTLTSDRPAQVYWLQTPIWHADLRIPNERPDFSNVTSLEQCSDEQLRFIAGQEAFAGITKVDGIVCTWLRLHDLQPGTALDIGRMNFETPDLLIERGITEDYLEHWARTEGSVATEDEPFFAQSEESDIVLTSGDWRVEITPRALAVESTDPYTPISDISRDALLWRASLCVSLSRKRGGDWITVLSTHPWKEDAAGGVSIAP